MPNSAQIEAVLTEVDQGLDASLARLFDVLRIPSISTDPAYAGDCQRAADWLAEQLSQLGFEATAHPTPGHSIVLAHDRQETTPEAGPHVLFYGHYDVQPVDPLELWHSDPFDPQIRTDAEGRKIIVARGASDDKGQMLTFIEACRAWRAAFGTLPVRVTMVLEGEEEAGGKNLPAFLKTHAEALRADIALICDTDMWDRKTPAIVTMLRGTVADEIEIAAADRDLHSGMFGNAARNPNQVLAEIIASLRAPDGSVAIAGFYDDVAEIPPQLKAQWDGLGFDEKEFLGAVGLSQPAGESGRSVLETVWARPSCEINGMSGGYVGAGFKTVIPAKARAKISFRLVSGMDPEKIRAAFRAHVEARLPPDCSVRFTPHGGSPAIVVSDDGGHLERALNGLSAEWEQKAITIGSGGSIPVAGDFKAILGLDSLLIGFAQVDDQIHSPNEKYDLESFHRGIRSWVRILAALAE